MTKDTLQPVDWRTWLNAWLASEPDGTLPRLVRQLMEDFDAAEAALAAKPATAYPVPGPYDIAMTFGAALAGSGRYDTPGAAMAAAWLAVPEFYQARDTYLRELAPLMFAMGAGSEGGDNDGAGQSH